MRSVLEFLKSLFGGNGEPPPAALRLVERFTSECVDGRVAPPPPPPRTQWRFAEAGPATVFEAGAGIADLALRDGMLTGRTTDDVAILRVEGPPHEDGDYVHSVEIRLRASAGKNLAVEFHGTETVDLAAVAADPGRSIWRLVSPLIPGEETRTYVCNVWFPVPSSEVRHVLVRPTNASGASFAIESIRVVFEREHLAEIPSGVGWHGLREIYYESIVARAPETIRFPLTLPARPWLDLSVGTVEEARVTFRISVRKASKETRLLERTVTTPHRWEALTVDLGALAGDTVDLSLSIAAEKPGTIGLWGAPVVRSRTATAGNRPQGVIFILADTLRRDHLDAYGYGRETAPVLRRLASEGALFRDSVTQATWTKVSTPSIMTGLYPTSHGVAEFFDRLPGAANTLAEALRDAGYATLSLSSVAFSGKLTNLHKGFEQLHESSSLPEPSTVASKTAREYVDRLLPWLEAHREGPFFVFLHIFDPHDPYEPHRPYNTLWGNGSRRAEHQRQVEDVRKLIADPLLRLFAMPTREEILQAGFDPDAYIEQERDWYDGSIRAMDVEIGRLVERLRDLGLDEKTLIVFTSDHGEEFLDHGRMFHGQNVYGELTQVPLLFWWPGRLPAGTVVDETVQTIDVMPTILEMAGLPLPAGIQGRSLVPVLTGGASPRAARPAISEKAATADGALSPPPRETESVAIVVDGWKLIRNTRRAEGQAEFELYDHRTDPLNHADLAVAKPDVVARLAAELEAWKAKAEAARLPRDAEAPEELDAEVLERLRALGYVE